MRRFGRLGRISLTAASLLLGGKEAKASHSTNTMAITNRPAIIKSHPAQIIINPAKHPIIPKEHLPLYNSLAKKFEHVSSVIYVGDQRVKISAEFAAKRAFLHLLREKPTEISRYFRNQHDLEMTKCERAAKMQIKGIMPFAEALSSIDRAIQKEQKSHTITNPFIDSIADSIEASHQKK